MYLRLHGFSLQIIMQQWTMITLRLDGFIYYLGKDFVCCCFQFFFLSYLSVFVCCMHPLSTRGFSRNLHFWWLTGVTVVIHSATASLRTLLVIRHRHTQTHTIDNKSHCNCVLFVSMYAVCSWIIQFSWFVPLHGMEESAKRVNQSPVWLCMPTLPAHCN